MHPVDFPEKNITFQAPPNMPECQPLPAHIHPGGIISCWQISDEELEILVKTKQIYLCIATIVQPPVSLMVEMPFTPETEFPDTIDG